MSKPPILAKPIPPQVVNEGAAFGPLNLNDYIHSSDGESGSVTFFAELEDGSALPKGLICTSNGTLSGIPAAGTKGNYRFVIVGENESGIPCTAQIAFTIKTRLVTGMGISEDLAKAKVWAALTQNLPLPELTDFLNRPITIVEIYYLLERFATLTIWDVYNLDMPGDKHLLQLEGSSPHYHVYDRGSCLVAAPKDLFSHERTLEDALQTARAMAREVHTRSWTVELSGFNKMSRATWIELQLLAAKTGKSIDVMRYTPSQEDLNIYAARVNASPSPNASR